MRKIALFLIAFCSIVSYAVGEERDIGKLSGIVTGPDNELLEFVNVIVYKDSVLVSGGVTDENGRFSIDCNIRSVNRITANLLGYAPVDITVSELLESGVIYLHPAEVRLGEVVVSGSVPVTRIDGGAMVTNVENSVLAMAGTANDVLEHVPLVSGNDGEFTVLGRGTPLVYINGRQVRNAAELEQLSSQMIKSVEVISNPGVQYAANIGAVIKIRTKRPQGDGIGVELRTTNQYNRYFRTKEQVDVKFRTGGLEVFGMGYFNREKQRIGMTFDQTTFADNVWNHRVESNSVNHTNSMTGKIGFSYMLNENHSLGAYYEYGHGRRWSNLSLDSDISSDGTSYDRWISESDGYGHDVPSHTANLYYNGKIGQVDVDFNADYVANSKNGGSKMYESSENFEDRIVNSWNTDRNRLWAEKLNIGFNIGKGRMEIGEEATVSRIRYQSMSEGTGIPNSITAIHENNVAAFARYAVQIDRYNLAAGLRYEHADFKYYNGGRLMDDRSRAYDNLFPYVSVATQIRNVQLTVDFTNRTRRPNYSQLDGNTSYVNRMTYQRGNPFLKPVTMYVVSATAMWRYFYAQAVYNHEVNSIFNTMERYDNDPLIRLITFENVPHYTQTHIAIGAQPTVGCWQPRASLALFKQWYEATYRGQKMNFGNPFLFITFKNTLKLPYDWTVNIDFSWQSAGDGQNTHMKSNNSLDIGVTKQWMRGNLTLNIKGYDLLNQRDQRLTMYNGDILLKADNHTDTRSVRLRLTYKFNSSRSRYRGTGARESEKARISQGQ